MIGRKYVRGRLVSKKFFHESVHVLYALIYVDDIFFVPNLGLYNKIYVFNGGTQRGN
jgi:hypothetical protein